jgi:DNA-binding SARP family transcriptional activator
MQIAMGYAIISGNRHRSVSGEKQIGDKQHVRAVAVGNVSEELVMEGVESRSTAEGKDALSLPASSQASNTQHEIIPIARVTTCGSLTIEVLQAVQPGPDGQPQPIYGPPDATWLAKKGASTALTLLGMLASQPHCFAPKDWLSEKLGHPPTDEDEDGEGLKRLDNVAYILRSLLYPPRADETPEDRQLRRRLVAYQRASSESGPGYRLAGMPLLWLDVTEISAHMKRARRLEQFGEDGFSEWQAAYELAKQGIFLPQEVYSDWATWRRQEVEAQWWDCVQVLSKRYREQGAAGEERALQILREYWLQHPTNEDALRPLLELLGKREWFGQAEEYYRQMCKALEEEGAEPDRRTQETIEFVRALQIQREQATNPGEMTKHSHAPLASPDDQQDGTYILFSQAAKQGIIDAIRELVGEDMDQLRRQFLQQILIAAGTTLLVPADTLLHRLEQTDTFQSHNSYLRPYEYLLVLSWKQYYAGGSQTLLPIIDDCLHALINAAREAHTEEQEQFLALLCRFYQLSGVIARDRLDITRALADGKKSIELAFTLDDAELITASLFRRAKTYLKQQCPEKALQDLEAALIYARRARDPLKGYVHQAAAEAYTSIAGPADRQLEQESLTLLDNVESLLHNGHLEDDGSFVKVNISGVSMDRARVLTHFRKAPQARQALVTARQHLGPELIRWQCRLLLADAEVHFAEDDVQSCCEALSEALKIARATHSLSNEARIDTWYQQLNILYAHQAPVRQLGEQLHSS